VLNPKTHLYLEAFSRASMVGTIDIGSSDSSNSSITIASAGQDYKALELPERKYHGTLLYSM